jgi:carbon-monoxide dehydrogenase medium subunit
MYPPNFDYYRASSVDEALSLLKQHGDARLLAGGHSLLPAMKFRLASPAVLVDISKIKELSGIKASGGVVRIGATTTHAAIAASKDVPKGLADAAAGVGDPQVRNRGTIGGNVSNADPASDLPTILVALGATFKAVGAKGERSISAADFFTGMFATALADGDLLTAIEVPAEGKGTGSAYTKLADPASRYALVGAGVSLTLSGGKCSAASVAAGGLTPVAARLPSVEKALVGNALNRDTIAAAAEAAQGDLSGTAMGSHAAAADYRLAMATVYVRRAIEAAASRAG